MGGPHDRSFKGGKLQNYASRALNHARNWQDAVNLSVDWIAQQFDEVKSHVAKVNGAALHATLQHDLRRTMDETQGLKQELTVVKGELAEIKAQLGNITTRLANPHVRAPSPDPFDFLIYDKAANSGFHDTFGADFGNSG